MKTRINGILNLEDTKKAINEKRKMVIAAEDDFLAKLPKGNWIGGTSPYSMSAQGGACLPEQAFVQELPDLVTDFKISVYDAKSVSKVFVDAPENGFSILMLPAFTDIHTSFAIGAPSFPEFGTKPLIGWVTGAKLEVLGKSPAKVYNGMTGESSTSAGMVAHASLPDDRFADMGIVNIFESSATSDTLEFNEDSFAAKEVMVNGVKKNFAEYMRNGKFDIRWPLVGNYGGALANLSFADVGADEVKFLAPVFRGISYKFSSPMGNYEAYLKAFRERIPTFGEGEVAFTCNCVLNYKYGELDGQKIVELNGPFVFGEIAYQLLNQTLVYLTVHKRA